MSDVVITCICGKHQIDIKKDQDLFNFLEQSNLIEGVTDATSMIQALEAWSYLEDQAEITPSVILKLHKILMLHQHLMPNEKGYFRTIQVQVGGREGIRWEKIPLEIEEWCKDAMTSVEVPGEDGKHIKIDHISYEKIHPFFHDIFLGSLSTSTKLFGYSS